MTLARDGSPTIDDLLRIAREDIARNRLSAAEKALEQAILMDPQVAEAFHQLGCVYHKKGKFKKAMHTFQRALDIDPTHTEASIALSGLFNDTGKYQEGAATFLRAKKRLEGIVPGHDPRINQQLAEKHYEIAMLYCQFERYREAQTELTKAIQLGPDSITYGVQLGKVLAKSGEKEKALQFLKRLLEDFPNSPELRIQLGIIYYSQKRMSEAKREWEEAIALDPENRSAQMYMGIFDYEPAARPTFS